MTPEEKIEVDMHNNIITSQVIPLLKNGKYPRLLKAGGANTALEIYTRTYFYNKQHNTNHSYKEVADDLELQLTNQGY